MTSSPIAAACGLLLATSASVIAAPVLPDFAAALFVPGAAIANPYLSLPVGSKSVLVASGVADGEPFEERDVQKVLGQGPTILGVQATTVLDRAFEDGVLVEATHDYYAQDTAGNVWYLGEDVTNYAYDDDGNLVSTDDHSAWLAGENGAWPGWAMPAQQTVGFNYYQEYAPADDAVDEGTTFALLPSLDVGGATYADVLQVYEASAAEPNLSEFKYYALGLGLIRADEDLDAEFANPGLIFERVPTAAVPLPAGLPLAGLAVTALVAATRRGQRTPAAA